MLLVREREIINPDLGVLKALVTLATLGVRHLACDGKWDGPLGMTLRAGSLFARMALETGLLWRAKGRRIVRVMIDVVMAIGTGGLHLLDVKAVRNGEIIRINLRRGPFDVKDPRVAADAVWINLIELGREAGMFSSAFKGKDVDARCQGMARSVTFRTIDLWMDRRLLPERGFSLLLMAGEAELLSGRCIGRQAHSSAEAEDGKGTPHGPTPERKLR